MYFESDYILRMIGMAGAFFRRLMGLCDDQKTEEAARELDAMAKTLTGLDMRALAQTFFLRACLPPGEGPEMEPAVGELLAAYAVLLEKLGDTQEAQRMGEAAVLAICGSTETADIAEERWLTLSLLLDRLPMEPSAALHFALARTFALANRHVLMENHLFLALEESVGAQYEEILHWGCEVFVQIARDENGKSDLPREEIGETLTVLQKRREKLL